MFNFYLKNNKINLFCYSIKIITEKFLIETKKNTGLKKSIVSKKTSSLGILVLPLLILNNLFINLYIKNKYILSQ